jgi:hypothetical protein
MLESTTEHTGNGKLLEQINSMRRAWTDKEQLVAPTPHNVTIVREELADIKSIVNRMLSTYREAV